MPTYDYKCDNCKNTFELFQSIKEDPITLCPECGHNTLKKMISMPAGLIFKGSGFYLTDYAKKSSSATDKTDKKDTASTPKTEKKPEVKEKKTAEKKKE
jgi:putative FmdB family regulatory protein